jgi:hypothetical protein
VDKKISGKQLLCYLIAVTVMGTRVVITITVDDVSVEAIFIGEILDGPYVTTGLLQGVLAHNLVAVTRFLLSVRVSSLVVGDAVRVLILRVGLGIKTLCV